MIICNFPTYNRNNEIAFGNLTKFAQNSSVQNSLNSSVEKISTLKQVDKAIFEMKTGMKIGCSLESCRNKAFNLNVFLDKLLLLSNSKVVLLSFCCDLDKQLATAE